MAITNEQLQRYWEANPQELEKAVASNPGMFGLSSQTSDFNVGVTGAATQRQPVGTGMMSSGMTLEQLRAQNQAYNAANTMPAGFDASLNYSAGPNTFGGTAGQTFDSYLSQGTATQQQNRTGTFNLGGVSLIRPDGRVTSTPSTFAPEVQQTVLQELNQQEQAYTNQLQNFFQGEGTMPSPPDPYSIFEKYGLPSETVGPDGSLLKLNPVTGQYEGGKRPEDSAFAQLVKQTPAIMGAVAGGPLAGAIGGGLTSATQGGNIGDVLQAAALGGFTGAAGDIAKGMNLTGIGSLDKALGGATVGGATAAIGGGDTRDILGSAAVGGLMQSGVLDDILPPIYSADNFAGSFVSGATNDVITQAIMTGDLSVQDALQSGLIQMGIDTVKDIYDDSGQTRNVGDMYEGGTRVDGMELDPNQLSTIRSTSDVHGLLGPDGFLSKVGLNVGEMPTSWIGNAIEFLSDSPRRTMVNIDGKEHRIIQDKNTGSWVALNPDGTLNESISANAIENAYLSGNLYEVQREGILPRTDLTAYDERFFDVTTKRSSDSPYEGIWYDPRTASRFNWTGGAVLDSTGTQIRPGGIPDSVPPPSASAPVVTRPPVDVPPPTFIEDAMDQYQDAVGDSDIDVGIDEDVEPAEDIDEEEKAENLIEEDLLGTGDTGTVGGISPDSPLQSTVDDEDFQGTGGQGGTGVEDELLGGGQGQGTLPEEEKLPSAPGSGASDIERLLAVASAVLPGGGGGGGRRRGGLFDGGKEPAKNFMAGIEYIVPMLQQMNIPLEDFLVMWMNRE